ncbi:4-hydroxyphenylpyruvate dioxygenase [Acrasis kona]|uniref:4-hydroxyphenylpyruvate dioxygenase n=1 Tax=Acrasis kona TaxID=1008807 RepID=A0AAW2ZFZ9_9EUKA
MSNKAVVPAGKFLGYDHLHFWVGNAKQAASFYTTRMGFKHVAYRGLETGSREVVTHVINQKGIYLAFSSTLRPNNKEMGDWLSLHGDGVKDVAFAVSDVDAIYNAAVTNGATSIKEPHEVKDETGTVRLASVQTYGDTIHTFVDRSNYKGVFLPGFKASEVNDPLAKFTDEIDLEVIDHIVGNMDWNGMKNACDWYEEKLGFRRFWSVDDNQIHTEFSALSSIVMTDVDEKVKMPINEPAKGKKKSQIEEYVEFYGGAGVQHIALLTHDILKSVKLLKERGVDFLSVPDTYYDLLRKRLANSDIKVTEDLDVIQKLNILVDFDENGYLLQIFTKPVEDRPTLFFEVIQRHNNNGFGVGNFKALFKAIEDEQAKRGTLTDEEH